MSNRPLIIMIISHAHSGSTLLDKTLGSCPIGFSLGEITNFSRLVDSDTVYCGCERLYIDCTFWCQIKKNIEKAIIKENIAFNSLLRVIRRKYIYRDVLYYLGNIIFGYRFITNEQKRAIISTKLIYDAVQRKTNSIYMVDSSKRLSRALLLKSQLKNIYDFKFIHLVRDGRAVLGSFHRKKITFELTNSETGSKNLLVKDKKYIPPYVIIRNWLLRNLFASVYLLFVPKCDSLFMRYEDFTIDPVGVLSMAYKRFNIKGDSSLMDLKGKVNHIMGGHAARVNAKLINKAERKWDKQVPIATLRKFYIFAGWLNKLYGY